MARCSACFDAATSARFSRTFSEVGALHADSETNIPPLFAAAFGICVARVKEWSAGKRLELRVPVGLLFPQLCHRWCRTQHLPCSIELAHLDHLQDELLIQVVEKWRRKLERRSYRHHRVPPSGLHVGHEGVDAVDCVERNVRLLLQHLHRARERVLLQELQHDLDDVGGLDFHRELFTVNCE